MFEKLRELSGTEPVKQDDGSYTPSRLSLKVAAPSKTDYDHASYPNALSDGKKKVLVLCTEERFLTTANGEKFRTGNHPVELFVVLLHLEKAGFGCDLATISGAPVAIEDWAIPEQDEAVIGIMERYRPSLEKPLSLSEVIASRLGKDSPYVAVFIPGGHGAILGLPESREVKQVLRWAIDSGKYIIAICHGPAAFLSLTLDENPQNFPFHGYKYSGFPDSGDKLLPCIGYLPGKMPWYFGEKLDDLGMKNVSNIPSGTVKEDRRLLTGDGPLAANALGELAAKRLLEACSTK
ncbi:MAG: DJ-1/PfpI family protein [Phycisphaerales bacterium]|nr:DJ-1/PfpI family protein [Phycisphaerales bacterium]